MSRRTLTLDEVCALLLRRVTPRCSRCRRELDDYAHRRPTWTVDDAAGTEPLCDACYQRAACRRWQDRVEGPVPSAVQVLARLQQATAHDPR